MIKIKVDMRSLAATIFLCVSLYVMMRTSQGSLESAMIEMGFITITCICLYFSYRLILIVNDVY